MKWKILTSSLLCSLFGFGQTVAVPDLAFKRELLTQGVDLNGDGQIQTNEAERVTVLYVKNQGIQKLDGISSFINLREFGCYGNQLTQLDLRTLSKLEYLYANDNQLETIAIDGLTELKHIYLQNNPNLLVNLDFLQFQKLEELYVENTRSPRLNLKNLKNLTVVEASSSRLSELLLDGCINLKQLWISKNVISHLDLRSCTSLEAVQVSYNPIKTIDIRQLKNLKTMSCLDCYQLSQINTSGCENLQSVLW